MMAIILTRVRAILVSAVLAGAYALAGCSSGTEEERVLAVVDAIEKAAEARDTSETMALIADDYTDDRGLDKSQLREFIRGYYLIHPRIELLTTVGDVEFPGKGIAQVRVDFVMVGTEGSTDASSLTGDRETLDLELRERNSEWRVFRVSRVTSASR